VVRLRLARDDPSEVALPFGLRAVGYLGRDTLGDAHWNVALSWFVPTALCQRGGTEAEACRAGQEREDATHRGGRPVDCHVRWIGSERKTGV
jgi:hypothetical protein